MALARHLLTAASTEDGINLVECNPVIIHTAELGLNVVDKVTDIDTGQRERFIND